MYLWPRVQLLQSLMRGGRFGFVELQQILKTDLHRKRQASFSSQYFHTSTISVIEIEFQAETLLAGLSFRSHASSKRKNVRKASKSSGASCFPPVVPSTSWSCDETLLSAVERLDGWDS